MKKLIKNISLAVAGVLTAVALGGLVSALLPQRVEAATITVPTQNPLPTLLRYPLTNSTTFKLATGSTNMATAALTLINSAPFILKPGRGFSYQLSFVGTNANANAVTPYFQFANTYYSNGVLVTNWSQYFPGQGQIANGTTVVNALTNMLPWVVDNFQLGRLAVVSNAHNASTLLDPTNTFVFIAP